MVETCERFKKRKGRQKSTTHTDSFPQAVAERDALRHDIDALKFSNSELAYERLQDADSRLELEALAQECVVQRGIAAQQAQEIAALVLAGAADKVAMDADLSRLRAELEAKIGHLEASLAQQVCEPLRCMDNICTPIQDACINIHICIHTGMHSYIHTYIHTYIP